jgi:hypothetical protein
MTWFRIQKRRRTLRCLPRCVAVPASGANSKVHVGDRHNRRYRHLGATSGEKGSLSRDGSVSLSLLLSPPRLSVSLSVSLSFLSPVLFSLCLCLASSDLCLSVCLWLCAPTESHNMGFRTLLFATTGCTADCMQHPVTRCVLT